MFSYMYICSNNSNIERIAGRSASDLISADAKYPSG